MSDGILSGLTEVLSSLWAITKNSFTEIIRQPIYGILVGIGLALIALSPLIAMFALLHNQKLVADMGLATILLTGIVLAVLSASQVVSREIDAKTAGTVMSKPVGRLLFVTGKFLGVTLALAAATYLFTVVLLMTLRIGVASDAAYRMDYPALLGEFAPFFVAMALAFYCNYFYRWNFPSTAVIVAVPLYALSFLVLLIVDGDWRFAGFAQGFAGKECYEVFLAAVLVFLGVWVISSIAVAVSTRLNAVPNVIICLAVFFVGMVSRYLFGQYAESSFPAWVAYRVVPFLEGFWVADQLMRPEPYIPLHYVGLAGAYAAMFSVSMVLFAAFLFERRELI